MSKIIATSAIKGAYKTLERAEQMLAKSIEKNGEEQKVEFPDTGYFLPVIYSMSGVKVEKLSDCKKVLEEVKKLLPAVPSEKMWLPYLFFIIRYVRVNSCGM
jgi:acetyl-CoA synthase